MVFSRAAGNHATADTLKLCLRLSTYVTFETKSVKTNTSFANKHPLRGHQKLGFPIFSLYLTVLHRHPFLARKASAEKPTTCLKNSH